MIGEARRFSPLMQHVPGKQNHLEDYTSLDESDSPVKGSVVDHEGSDPALVLARIQPAGLAPETRFKLQHGSDDFRREPPRVLSVSRGSC